MSFPRRLLRWLPQLDVRVWILFGGRLLSQMGTGFTLFYAAIFFSSRVGLSNTQVGIGLAAMALSGIAGRILGGSMADSPRWGRRSTLLWSTAISTLGALCLAGANNFGSFVVANLVTGIGQGLFWPASEAAVADITTREQRNEAYALTRLADNLGLGTGVALSGLVVAFAQRWAGEEAQLDWVYRSLFAVDAVSFAAFFAVLYWAVTETRQGAAQSPGRQGWSLAFHDRSLLVYAVVNVLFTTYLSQVSSSLPLYFSNFLHFPPELISGLFTAHIALAALAQLPVARALNRLSRTRALGLSLLLWAVGFGLVWLAWWLPGAVVVLAFLALAVMALGMVVYNPSASALVVDLSPTQLRGVYLSINSLCWAVGYAIGPALGGATLDLPRPWANLLWPGLALSTLAGFVGLGGLSRILPEPINRGARP